MTDTHTHLCILSLIIVFNIEVDILLRSWHNRCLKILCLPVYLDTLITGHTLGNVLSTLNEIALQKELQHFMANNIVWTKKRKILNAGLLYLQSDALLLSH